MRTTLSLLGCVLVTLLWTGSAAAQATDFDKQKSNNWHQWRGPNADGVATNANPPFEWSESKNVAWKVAIAGEGSSTPIIWNDRVYLVAAVETDQAGDAIQQHPEAKTAPTGRVFSFNAICLDRASGKEIWKKTLASVAPHEGRHSTSTYAAGSPVTDGKHLYVSFGSFGVYCLTLDGEVVWKKELGKMRTRRGWGEGVSPVVADGKVIVMWDQEDQSKIFALNSRDGSIAWEKLRDEPTTWATPLVVGDPAATQIITAGTNGIRSYDARSGSQVWKSGGLTLNAIPCPILAGDHVICMSGYRGNVAVSLDLESAKSTGSPEVVWRLNRDTPYVTSPLLTQGRLYFTKSLNAILSCVDVKTGEPIFETQRLPGLRSLYASPVATDKYIYLPSREGAILVLENSDEFKVVATNRLDAGIDASPAIVGDQLFIRTNSHLYCLQDNQNAQQEQEKKSVKPGINANFLDPNLDVDDFVKRFEIESREVFGSRLEILKHCEIEPSSSIADIGAGTGIFTRLFARTVGAKGRVYAVDIAPNFLSHIRDQTQKLGMDNVTPVLCSEDSANLPDGSIDLAFICDTYHHFEYPAATLKSIHQALRNGGRLVVIDFERIPGKTRQWLLGHVRAGKEVFQKEIEEAGFKLIAEKEVIGFDENYFLIFEKN